MSWVPGERLGPYEIVSPLGAGGMGEVYSALDTRLGRTVAIKRTQERFTERFQREARLVSALNHPNICHLYDVGPDYLVMELVDGSPVAPADSPRKLLDLAVQMADGLSAAHAAGIVHRDLKPDNILVTREGRVKILDFGLATERKARGGADEETKMATGTEPGTILGTFAYMSPEQARGEMPLTAQSDQFSLGLVLYELAAGRRAFQRASTAETMTAIIREDPDPLPPSTPAPLRWVIERLLAKDPADRYDSTRDLYRELRLIRERLSEASGVATAMVEPVRGRRRIGRGMALTAGLLAGVLLGGVAGWRALPRTPTAAANDLSAFKFTAIATEPVEESDPSWAPDGKSIAYVAIADGLSQIFTRAVGGNEAAQITREPAGASNPSWSPDGSAIYFNSAGGLWVVGSAGGTPDRVFERAGRYAIHPDGKTIAFQRGGAIWAAARGEEPREIPYSNEIPRPRTLIGFSPDGTRLAANSDEAVWILGFPAEASPQHHRIDTIQDASWMPDSRRLVLTRILGPSEHTLSMLDSVTGQHRVFYTSPHAMTSGAVSHDGTRIAYVSGRIQWNITEVGTADARTRALNSSADISQFPAWMPGGTRYLFTMFRGGRWSIQDASLSDGMSRHVMDTDTQAAFVRMAPGGSQFTFMMVGADGEQLMLANPSGRMSRLDPGASGSTSDAIWSPDGRYVMYTRSVPGDRFEVVRIRPGSTSAPEVLATYQPPDNARIRMPIDWSPDGNLVLTRSGQGQFYLSAPNLENERPVPSARLCPNAVGFSRDGRAVLGICRNSQVAGAPWQLWSVDVATGSERMVGTVDVPPAASGLLGFSMHPDGTRVMTSVGILAYDIWMLEGFESQ